MDTSSDSEYSTTSSNSQTLSEIAVDCFYSWQQQLQELVHEISTTCVLNEHAPLQKTSQIPLLDVWCDTGDMWFQKKLCVNPETFDGLLDLIGNHVIFKNNANTPQLLINIQLAIFLFCAGHSGNAAFPEGIAQWAGVSVGAVNKCTKCVAIAVLALHDRVIHLPTSDEKEASMDYVEETTCQEWHYLIILETSTGTSEFGVEFMIASLQARGWM